MPLTFQVTTFNITGGKKSSLNWDLNRASLVYRASALAVTTELLRLISFLTYTGIPIPSRHFTRIFSTYTAIPSVFMTLFVNQIAG